jgi:quercetin dioxygenase-like cupin family protein
MPKAPKKQTQPRQKVYRKKPAGKTPKTSGDKVPKSRLKHVIWSSVEPELLNPLFQRQLMVGDKIMLSRIILKKGCVVPLHSHHNEQVSYVLEGRLTFQIDGRDIEVKAGEVLAIPPHMPHRVEALVDSLSLDIFNPPREDWLSGTDSYLRGGKRK